MAWCKECKSPRVSEVSGLRISEAFTRRNRNIHLGLVCRLPFLFVGATYLFVHPERHRQRKRGTEREREKRKRQKEREREGQGEIERKREREWWRWGKRQRDERIELLVLLQTWPCEFAF